MAGQRHRLGVREYAFLLFEDTNLANLAFQRLEVRADSLERCVLFLAKLVVLWHSYSWIKTLLSSYKIAISFQAFHNEGKCGKETSS